LIEEKTLEEIKKCGRHESIQMDAAPQHRIVLRCTMLVMFCRDGDHGSRVFI